MQIKKQEGARVVDEIAQTEVIDPFTLYPTSSCWRYTAFVFVDMQDYISIQVELFFRCLIWGYGELVEIEAS